MSGKNALLDTNAVIQFMKSEPHAVAFFQQLKSFNIPSIVVGELYFGVYKSENKHRI